MTGGDIGVPRSSTQHLVILLALFIVLGQIMTEQVDVVVLSGQSNMAGRGGVHSIRLANGTNSKYWDGIVPLQSQATSSTILRFNADLHWEDAREPLHADVDIGKVCGIGPGLTFAATMVNHGMVGLVPCARGATSIREWAKGGTLYATMVDRTKAALSQKEGSSLKALLWYQGESDTLSKELADKYHGKLVQFIQDVRTDLQREDLPFIQVGITAENHPHPDLLAQVRVAQQDINLPNVFYVDAQGLPLQEDGVHLTMDSQVELGKKLAELYNSLNTQNAHTIKDVGL